MRAYAAGPARIHQVVSSAGGHRLLIPQTRRGLLVTNAQLHPDGFGPGRHSEDLIDVTRDVIRRAKRVREIDTTAV